MSTTYKTVAGDSFSLIARKKLGDDKKAGVIQKANPGVFEPIQAGISIIIPGSDFTASPVDAADNEVQISISQKRFRYWSRLRINRACDNIDTISFLSPFEAIKNPDFKKEFEPFSFADVSINVGTEVLFSGVMLTPQTSMQVNSTSVNVSCYARPGLLEANMPASSYPVEYRRQNIEQIARSVCAPFGVGVVFESQPGPLFKRVALGQSQPVLNFLKRLAQQRALVMSNTAQGNLLFWQSVKTGNPVAVLEQGKTPLITVVPSFNAQRYYSHVTGIKSVRPGSRGTQYTVANPHIGPVLRPLVFDVPDSKDADTQIATEAKIARMFANAVQYRVQVDTWRDPEGNLWKPNTTIIVQAPDARIDSFYEFLIRSVELNKNPNAETATLMLTLPGAFSGEVPEFMPWQN